MTANPILPLYEKILLLALDDEKGTTPTGDWFVTAMGGAILAELVLLGALHLADDTKKTVSVADDFSQKSDPLLRDAVDMVRESKKPHAASGWVMRFARMPELKNRAARQLVAKGVLTEEVGTVLKIFKRPLFREQDHGPEQRLIASLEEAIFTDTPEVAQRTVIILALIQAVGILDRIFDRKRLHERQDRLHELTSGLLVGQATREAVEAIQAAIYVCTMVPVISAGNSS